MPEDLISPSFVRHMELIQALSKPGFPLAVDAPTATINNREWLNPRGNKFTRSRKSLHERLKAEQESIVPHVQKEHRAIVLAGPPGAGKSTTLRTVLEDTAQSFITVDADEFKIGLLRQAVADGSYESWIKPAAIKTLEAQGERFFPMELAALVHEESSRLAASFRKDLLASGANVIIDTVLASEKSAKQLSHLLAQNNYQVQIIDVEVPENVSRDAIQHRWLHGYRAALKEPASHLGGRWVPSEYLHTVFNGPDGKSWPEHHAQQFAINSPNVTRYRRYRALTATGERKLELDLHRPHSGSPLTAVASPHPKHHLGTTRPLTRSHDLAR